MPTELVICSGPPLGCFNPCECAGVRMPTVPRATRAPKVVVHGCRNIDNISSVLSPRRPRRATPMAENASPDLLSPSQFALNRVFQSEGSDRQFVEGTSQVILTILHLHINPVAHPFPQRHTASYPYLARLNCLKIGSLSQTFTTALSTIFEAWATRLSTSKNQNSIQALQTSASAAVILAAASSSSLAE